MIVGAIRNSLEWCRETVIEKWNKREYASQDKGELIQWIERKVKEYDAISESKTGVIASYYLGKASGINEVKFFLSGLLTDNHSKQITHVTTTID
jgi:hypothetical protein